MLRIVTCLVGTLLLPMTLVMGMQDWNFILHRFEYNTSDPDLLSLNLRIIRKEPGVYAVNGTAIVGIDIFDKFEVEASIYRSPTGSGQYKITPYHVQKKPFCDFIKTFYEPILQDDLEQCAGLPNFTDKCKPIEKGVYTFNMCIVSNAGMPSHIDPGFYKIEVQLKSDDLEIWLTAYSEAESKGIN